MKATRSTGRSAGFAVQALSRRRRRRERRGWRGAPRARGPARPGSAAGRRGRRDCDALGRRSDERVRAALRGPRRRRPCADWRRALPSAARGGVLDAAAHVRRAADAHVKVVVVREDAARLLHQLGGAHPRSPAGRPRARRTRAGARAAARRRTGASRAPPGRRPAPPRAPSSSRRRSTRPARSARVPSPRNGTKCGARSCRPAALRTKKPTSASRPLSCERCCSTSPPPVAREVPDRHHGVGELPAHGARRAVEHRDERLEPPADVAGRVGGLDAQVLGLDRGACPR